ncbi:MAG TPA: alpha/beta hydrolase [Candidatus Eisenbacteria bacterium]|nr:alpha/beta hydrolase [Candidatus Eisenbacteria bacterium]
MRRTSIAWAAAALVAVAWMAPALADTPPWPPPGRMIDVGGWRLHLDAAGHRRPGDPCVVLESGLGDFSVEWSLVQPRVARFARVCSYDRGGDGWSELGPHPRTMHQIVYELHTLLARAGEAPPYVLVGHSYGAWLVRMYASEYPREVAGMVLVDGGADDPLRMLPDGRLVHTSEMAIGDTIPPVKTSGPLRESDIPPAAMAQIRSGLADASAHANDPPRDRLPAAAKQMRAWTLGQVRHVAAAVNPAENAELAELRQEHRAKIHLLGDMPLVVLMRGRQDGSDSTAKVAEDEHRKDEAALVDLSTRGRLVIVPNSGHHIHLERPDAVVAAIREVFAAADSTARQR